MSTSVAPPLYEAGLLVALRGVARGRIGAPHPEAPLTCTTQDLSSRVFTALVVLRRDGLVAVGSPDPRTGWCTATLAPLGACALCAWEETGDRR